MRCAAALRRRTPRRPQVRQVRAWPLAGARAPTRTPRPTRAGLSSARSVRRIPRAEDVTMTAPPTRTSGRCDTADRRAAGPTAGTRVARPAPAGAEHSAVGVRRAHRAIGTREAPEILQVHPPRPILSPAVHLRDDRDAHACPLACNHRAACRHARVRVDRPRLQPPQQRRQVVGRRPEHVGVAVEQVDRVMRDACGAQPASVCGPVAQVPLCPVVTSTTGRTRRWSSHSRGDDRTGPTPEERGHVQDGPTRAHRLSIRRNDAVTCTDIAARDRRGALARVRTGDPTRRARSACATPCRTRGRSP